VAPSSAACGCFLPNKAKICAIYPQGVCESLSHRDLCLRYCGCSVLQNEAKIEAKWT
jgi:hypothetical protein